ncbi:MAG: response regulator [Chloroflexi bacterium]|jgi:NarL family two-component system response regulator LiaR|nr:response regulator [Chloroflexota bacterium]
MSEPIGVLIVDDHALVRKGLLALLNVRPEVHVVGEAIDGMEAVHLASTQYPDVILMDLEMPTKDGITAIKEIREKQQESKILVLTSYTDDERVIAAIRAGANGYLLKTTTPDDLLQAIRRVHQGDLPLDPSITSTIVRQLNRPSTPQTTRPGQLTEREMDVIKLVAKGLTNQQIATELAVSERTVSTHVSRILTKLQLENRTQAALYALRTGLADLDEEV